jgi:exopolysaccharide biosynthesis protein
MAITGSQVLVRDGQVVARSDGLRAPRTAIGIDGDTGHVLLVTLDGRDPHAVGMRMRGWARFLARLGIDHAVNLDGGGSSTMVARTAGGSALAVVNRPSLGHQRRVPDAVTVDYAPSR